MIIRVKSSNTVNYLFTLWFLVFIELAKTFTLDRICTSVITKSDKNGAIQDVAVVDVGDFFTTTLD